MSKPPIITLEWCRSVGATFMAEHREAIGDGLTPRELLAADTVPPWRRMAIAAEWLDESSRRRFVLDVLERCVQREAAASRPVEPEDLAFLEDLREAAIEDRWPSIPVRDAPLKATRMGWLWDAARNLCHFDRWDGQVAQFACTGMACAAESEKFSWETWAAAREEDFKALEDGTETDYWRVWDRLMEDVDREAQQAECRAQLDCLLNLVAAVEGGEQ